MSEERKFELTWARRTGSRAPEPCLAFEVDGEAVETKTAYAAFFSVCATPRCPCLSVRVDCAPRLPHATASAAAPRQFWLDVGKRVVEITPELKAEPEALWLAQFISARLGETAWEELHRWFWAAKIKVIETADVSEIDLTGLPNADDGHMIPFIEVFPLGLSLNFTFEQADWAADEAYCVQLGCDCNQAILSFLKLRDEAGRKTTALQDVPAVRYDYRSHATEELAPGPAGTPPTSQLLAALTLVFPSLDPRLELHHRIMQSLYARHHLARASLQKERLEAQLQTEPHRTGRNDPCPCGSGKKFKKCCGA